MSFPVIFQPSVSGDFVTEVSLGRVSDYTAVNKFGDAPDCDSGVATDIWDGADGVTSTDIWAAPTQARIHALVSTSSADDDGSTGMRTIEIFGLKTWDDRETSETVILNGTSAVNTAESYVVIHRMIGRTFGSGEANAGLIKATAATDGTITAMIHIGNNQSRMAILAIPRDQCILFSSVHTSIAVNGTAKAQGRLMVKESADLTTSAFIAKELYEFGLTNPFDSTEEVPLKFCGPCIVKVQVTTDSANVECRAGFHGLIVSQQ